MLQAGWRVKYYVYVDNNPKAQPVAYHKMARLAKEYPEQFGPLAYQDSFSAENDITRWTEPTVRQLTKFKEHFPRLRGCCLGKANHIQRAKGSAL